MKPLPSSSPSNKRRRISNKENESPSASASSSSPRATFSPSRSDRGTLMDSPSHRSLTSRKRPFEDITESSGELVGKGRVLDFSEKERPTKRVRISVPIPSLVLPLAPTQRSASEVVPSPPVSQKESRKERELELESDCTPSSSSLRRTGSVLSRKRKALQIDCVEIKVSPAKVPLRFADVADEREMRTPTRRMSTRNRRKTTKESDTEKKFRTKTESATVASPVRGEDAEGDLDPDFHQAGKYEPIDLHSDSDCGSDAVGPIEQLSSDDDPYLGQVTPGHLISPVPALRRGRRAEEDEDEDEVPSSDDSDSSSSLFGSGGGGGGGRRGESSGQVSPLREVMIRRLQRTASADGSRSVTLGMSAIKTLEQLLNS
ncbi:hypothetical protein D9757_008472 [Collybiopsis confluens]|uniref:Uncharacterized protein n=1 Tax=Collybiopsis confluens TaxID=2823264 RepID=A0A8H5HFI4_9AGAR|nr:hypothetical protein D9757_008472 [Collybiopsis confluens]